MLPARNILRVKDIRTFGTMIAKIIRKLLLPLVFVSPIVMPDASEINIDSKPFYSNFN